MTARLVLFGSPRLMGESGQAVRLPSRKAMALLALLAMADGRALSRSYLAELLWSERPDSLARQNLRKELSRLRGGLRAAGAEGLSSDCDSIRLAAPVLQTDVREFRGLAGSDDMRRVETAVALYRGDLMSGFFVKAAGFEDWLSAERELLREQATDALQRLSSLKATAGCHLEAIAAARRALALAPFQDGAVSVLIEAYLAAGRSHDAIEAYEDYAATLRLELGVPPSQQVEALRRGIAAGQRQSGPAESVTGLALADGQRGRETTNFRERPLVAVVPASVVGCTGFGRALSEGLADRVVLELSRFQSLNVRRSDEGDQPDRRILRRDLGGAGRRGAFRLTGRLDLTLDRVVMFVSLQDRAGRLVFWKDRIELAPNAHADLTYELARRAAARAAPEILSADRSSLLRSPDEGADATSLAIRAIVSLGAAVKRHDPRKLRDGLVLARRALDLDARCGLALSAIAWGNTHRAMLRSPGEGDAVAVAGAACDRLLELFPENPYAHFRKGWLHLIRGAHDEAARFLRQSLLLNPNDVLVRSLFGILAAFGGSSDQAMSSAREAMRLAPRHPEIHWAYLAMQAAYFQREEAERGIDWGERRGMIDRAPASVLGLMAANYAGAGRLREAGPVFRQLYATVPHYVDAILSGARRPFKSDADNDRLVSALQAARGAV